MNKKGVIWEEFADIFLGGAILLVAILTYSLMTGMNEEAQENAMQNLIRELNHDEIFITYLNAEIEQGRTLGDLIIESYLNNDKQVLESNVDNFFTNIYLKKVCWAIYINDDKWVSMNSCTEENILNASASMPLPNNEIINTNIRLLGFVDE